MKTNTRIHRNGGKKSGLPQAPTKPESASVPHGTDTIAAGAGQAAPVNVSALHLEDVINRAAALTELLSHYIIWDESGKPDGVLGDAIKCGILSFTHDTQKRMMALQYAEFASSEKGGAR